MALRAIGIGAVEGLGVALEEGGPGAVEDDGRVAAVIAEDLPGVFHEAFVRPHLEFPVLLGTAHVDEIGGAGVIGIGAGAVVAEAEGGVDGEAEYVEPESADGVFGDFVELLDGEIAPGGAEAHPAGAGPESGVGELAVLVADAPLGVHSAGPVVEADAVVGRDANVALYVGFDLLTEEVAVEVVVAVLGGIEGGARLVLGEDVDGAEADSAPGFGNGLGVE